MIQRFQSLYLLLIAILSILLCFVSPVTFLTPESGVQEAQMLEFGFSHLNDVTSLNDNTMPNVVKPVMSTWALPTINIVLAVLALVIIFLYKKRILQARLCIILAIASVGYYAVLAVYVLAAKEMFALDWYLTPWAAIPLINFVLTIMSARAILKDEALVRAADRLR
ncbi:MAG: DUF4293 domain-containing protein [Paludibacteraceae bacterium]|nr:DUF4293 domain-containing protein [Paludibacteraceae bacterium]